MASKCLTCLKNFKDNERVIPVARYVVNNHRGDFVSNAGTEYVHYRCVKQAYAN